MRAACRNGVELASSNGMCLAVDDALLPDAAWYEPSPRWGLGHLTGGDHNHLTRD